LISLAKFLRLTGAKSEIVTKPLPVDDPKVRQPDITRAKKLLGWWPKVDFESGIRETIVYFRDKLGFRRSKAFSADFAGNPTSSEALVSASCSRAELQQSMSAVGITGGIATGKSSLRRPAQIAFRPSAGQKSAIEPIDGQMHETRRTEFPVAIPPVMPTADILCCSSAREQEALTSASKRWDPRKICRERFGSSNP